MGNTIQSEKYIFKMESGIPKEAKIFIGIALITLFLLGIGISYRQGYRDGGERVLELVNQSERVEIHILRIGDEEIGRDTVVSKRYNREWELDN